MPSTCVSSVWDLFESAALDDTGALMRRAWMPRAERALAAGAGSGVLFVDVDRFKQCNDVFGHQAGDLVLAALVHEVRFELRHVDLLGRYGGDELVVLLAGSLNPGQVHGIADRVRARVEGLRVPIPARPVPDAGGGAGEAVVDGSVVDGLSVSIGAALPVPGAPAGACALADLVSAADTAMYAAKRDGGNGVRISEVRARLSRRGQARHAR